MFVNRKFKDQAALMALLLACTCGMSSKALADDSPAGWNDAPGAGSEKSSPTLDARKGASAREPETPKVNERQWESPNDGTPKNAWTGKTAPAAGPKQPVPSDDSSTNIRQGDNALKAKQFESAIEFYNLALNGTPRPDNLTAAKALERKALALIHLQKLSDAERQLKQGVGYASTSSTKDPELVARMFLGIADILSQEGMPMDGLVVVKQAQAIIPGSKAQGTLIETELMNVQGRLLTDTGDTAGAEEVLLKALSVVDAAPRMAPENLPPLSTVSSSSEALKGKIKANLSHLRAVQGKAVESRNLAAEAFDIVRQHGINEPYDVRYSPIILSIRSNVTLSTAPTDEVIRTPFESALRDAEQLPIADNLIKATILYDYAEVKEDANDLTGALNAAKESYSIRSKVLPANSTELADSLVRISEVYLKLGRPVDAVAQATRAYAGLERSAGKGSLSFANASLAIGSTYLASSKFTGVENYLLLPVHTLQKLKGGKHAETLHAKDMLATLYLRTKRFAQAQQIAAQALAGGEKIYGANSPKLVVSLSTLGTADAHLKQFADANKYLQRAQSILAKAGKSNTPEFADVLAGLGVSNSLQKKWGAAESNLKQARTIYSRCYGPESPHVAQMGQLLKSMESLKAGPQPVGSNPLLRDFTPTAPQFQ